MNASIVGLGTANPPMYVTQREAWEFYDTHFDLGPQRNLYRRLLVDGPISGRYIGMHRTAETCETDPDRLLARFLEFGRDSAARAGRAALDTAGIAPADLAGVVVNTCTGYLCPGLSSYVAEDLGLPHAVLGTDLMGMGCGAALPNLRTAAGFVDHGPVLSIAVEICTATVFLDDDPGLTVSNCIFGDGAAAAVVAPGGGGLRLLDFAALLRPDQREHLRYRQDGGRLRNVLSPRVPILAGRAVRAVTDRLLAANGLLPGEIDHWIVHPGGTAVLDQVAEQLALPDGSLEHSRAVFDRYGNMSSPSVLFVLRELLDSRTARPGDLGVLLAFGAGFSAYALLIQFTTTRWDQAELFGAE